MPWCLHLPCLELTCGHCTTHVKHPQCRCVLDRRLVSARRFCHGPEDAWRRRPWPQRGRFPAENASERCSPTLGTPIATQTIAAALAWAPERVRAAAAQLRHELQRLGQTVALSPATNSVSPRSRAASATSNR